jgi:hypothetical protein
MKKLGNIQPQTLISAPNANSLPAKQIPGKGIDMKTLTPMQSQTNGKGMTLY